MRVRREGSVQERRRRRRDVVGGLVAALVHGPPYADAPRVAHVLVKSCASPGRLERAGEDVPPVRGRPRRRAESGGHGERLEFLENRRRGRLDARRAPEVEQPVADRSAAGSDCASPVPVPGGEIVDVRVLAVRVAFVPHVIRGSAPRQKSLRRDGSSIGVFVRSESLVALRRASLARLRRLGGGDGALGAPRSLRRDNFALAQLLKQPVHHFRPTRAVRLQGLAQGGRRARRREAENASVRFRRLVVQSRKRRRLAERGVDGVRRGRHRRREARGAARPLPCRDGIVVVVVAEARVPGEGDRHGGASRALRHLQRGQEEVVPAEARPLLRGRRLGVEPPGAVHPEVSCSIVRSADEVATDEPADVRKDVAVESVGTGPYHGAARRGDGAARVRAPRRGLGDVVHFNAFFQLTTVPFASVCIPIRLVVHSVVAVPRAHRGRGRPRAQVVRGEKRVGRVCV